MRIVLRKLSSPNDDMILLEKPNGTAWGLVHDNFFYPADNENCSVYDSLKQKEIVECEITEITKPPSDDAAQKFIQGFIKPEGQE